MPRRFEISRDFYDIPCIHSATEERCARCSAAISAWEKYVHETRYIWELTRDIHRATISERAEWYYNNSAKSAFVYSWVNGYNANQKLLECRRVSLKKAQVAAAATARDDYERSLTASSRRAARPLSVARFGITTEDPQRSLWLLIIPHQPPLINYFRLGRILRAIATKLVFQKELWNPRGAIHIIWRARVLLREPANFNELRVLLRKPANFDELKERVRPLIDLTGISRVNPVGVHRAGYQFQSQLKRDMPAECLDGPWCEDRRDFEWRKLDSHRRVTKRGRVVS
jgi:hypothetical protein